MKIALIIVGIALVVILLAIILPKVVLWALDKRLEQLKRIEQEKKCPYKVEKGDDDESRK